MKTAPTPVLPEDIISKLIRLYAAFSDRKIERDIFEAGLLGRSPRISRSCVLQQFVYDLISEDVPNLAVIKEIFSVLSLCREEAFSEVTIWGHYWQGTLPQALVKLLSDRSHQSNNQAPSYLFDVIEIMCEESPAILRGMICDINHKITCLIPYYPEKQEELMHYAGILDQLEPYFKRTSTENRLIDPNTEKPISPPSTLILDLDETLYPHKLYDKLYGREGSDYSVLSPNPELIEALAKFRAAGGNIGLYTWSPREIVLEILKHIDLQESTFNLGLCTRDKIHPLITGKIKGFEDMVEFFHMGIDRSSVWYVDNILAVAQAAKRYGLNSAWLPSPETTISNPASIDVVLQDLPPFIRWLTQELLRHQPDSRPSDAKAAPPKGPTAG